MSAIVIGIIDLLIVAAGWLLIGLDQGGAIDLAQPTIVAGATVSMVGVVTFFATLGNATENPMRNAIAAAFVAAYLPLLGFILFGPDIGGASGGSPQADELLKAFSAMVTVVVGFYFAAAAAQRINDRIQIRREIEAGAGTGGRADPTAPTPEIEF